jgi:hypothetical protein
VGSGAPELSFWNNRRGDDETSFGSQPFADNASALLAIGWPRLWENVVRDFIGFDAERVPDQVGDLLATKHGIQYFIGVGARNEMRQSNVGLNESYNLVLIRDALNKQLKNQGKTTDQITAKRLFETLRFVQYGCSLPNSNKPLIAVNGRDLGPD